jgi:general secretion pathway protein J
VLTRRESVATRDLRELDTLWLTTVSDTDTSQAVALQSDVSALTMRVWVNNSWRTNLDLPTPSPNAATAVSPPIPTGLEVTLQVRGHDTGLLKIFLLGAV